MKQITAKSWTQWNDGEWNRMLFHHFFAPDENDEPVTRLLVTARGLAKAVGCEPGQEGLVEERFRKMVTASPTRINARFRGGEFSFTSPYDEPPRALLHLLFTCYVASAGDEEVRNVGDYRRRMAKLLGHANEPHYPLEGLGDLWRQFDAWLGRARRAGFAWRRIRLPNSGAMVRIGYSLKLAFPHRRDQALLERILPAAGFAAQPPLRELLDLLRSWRDHFTDTFRAAYEEFRQSFIAGCFDREQSPLLDAVRDAIAHGEAERVRLAKWGRLSLVAERDDRHGLRLLLLSDRMPSGGGNVRIGAFQADRAHEPFQYAITFGDVNFAGADAMIEVLLADGLVSHWRGFARDPLARICRDGVLLFHRGASGTLECARNLNVEGDVWPLVHQRLATKFYDALRQVPKLEPRSLTSAYSDWREFSAIPAAQLRAINWMRDDALAGVRCLQQCAPESRIMLVGGLPTGEPRTWFGYKVVLPAVRVHGGVQAVTLNTQSGDELCRAERLAEEPELFSLRAFTDDAPLEGEHVLTAQRANAPPLLRRVCFRASVDRTEFLRPSKPERWYCEGALADMVPWDPAAAFADVEASGDQSFPHDLWIAESSESTSPAMSARVAALTEICAAQCLRRRDFSESDWIEIFERVFAIRDARLARWVLRAWVEAGLFDAAIDVGWRSRRLFARLPRLVILREAAGMKARLIGFTPTLLVNRLKQAVADLGGEIIQLPSISPWVAGAWEIRALEREALEDVTQTLSLEHPVGAPAPSQLVSGWARLRRYSPQRPLHYEKCREWNWTSRRFEQKLRDEGSVVRVEWWQRRERFDAPDFFVVTRNGVEEFVSYSRNWALLAAANIAEASPLVRNGGVLGSDGDPWAFLPLSVGRFCFAAGAAAAGPVREADGSWRYAYPLGNTAVARSILTNLGFASKPDRATIPRWLESLTIMRSRREPLVPVLMHSERRRVPASLRPLYIALGRNL